MIFLVKDGDIVGTMTPYITSRGIPIYDMWDCKNCWGTCVSHLDTHIHFLKQMICGVEFVWGD